MTKTLSIVGAGRVGRALARRLRECGWKIGVVSGRTEATARKAVRSIGGGRARSGITADLAASATILIAVPDDAIAGLAEELARACGKLLRGKIVLHLSGALGSELLRPVEACGARTGSMHPMQTFSGVSTPKLEGKLFAIEGDLKAVRAAREMARSLGGIPYSVPSGKKPLYHAAGTFAAGHVLALEESGVRMLMNAGMRRTEAVRALVSLTRQMLDNYENLGTQRAWTGPLSRGDYGVVAAHEVALKEFEPQSLEVYRVMSRQAAEVLAADKEEMLRQLQSICVGVTDSDEHSYRSTVKSKGESA